MRGGSDKPPLYMPSMAEVAAIPYSGRTVVSTFTGAGGSCLGFRMAGFRCVWALEFIAAARDTYRANFPDVPLDSRDVREVQPEEILEVAGLGRGEVDVMEGSPPCSSFSRAGRLQALWGKVRPYGEKQQRADDLFWEFARLLRGVYPKAFVAENVQGLTQGVSKGYFNEIAALLRGCGYAVRARVLDAQWLGVPQRRRRVIFVGVRADLGMEPEFPRPLPYRHSLREALALTAGEPAGVEDGAALDGAAIGREWDRLRVGEQSERYFSLIRPDLDGPCPTVTQMGGHRGAAGVTHPTERRKFTISELRLICGFPADFMLAGTYAQQWERLGRAASPPMMRAVAEKVREVLDRCEEAAHDGQA